MKDGNVQTAKWWLERRRRKVFCISDKASTESADESEDNELTIEIVDGGDDED